MNAKETVEGLREQLPWLKNRGYDAVALILETAVKHLEDGADEVERLTTERNLFKEETVALAKDVLRYKAVLKEVSGCHSKHDTPKLCDGCLISIVSVMDDDEQAEAVRP